ncbi:MAG: DUF1566 domain-containing protein [Desulfuromonadales bacterium]|nr:DUF1566 domain-containing protein [Desulfuromonadales bacterium]
MVKDEVTGLVWEVKEARDRKPNFSNPHDADNYYYWADSNFSTNGGDSGAVGLHPNTEDLLKELNDSNWGGRSDWRLPTVKELLYLVNRDRTSPAIDTDYFPNTIDYTLERFYLSSTSYYHYSIPASKYWCVEFSKGDSILFDKNVSSWVRVVSGAATENCFIDNGDGTVTDLGSGLMWQAEAVTTYDCGDPLEYCETLTLAGYNDWRLPDINELVSMYNYPSKGCRYSSGCYPCVEDNLFGVYASSTLAVEPLPSYLDGICFSCPPTWYLEINEPGGLDGKVSYGYSGYCVRAVRTAGVGEIPIDGPDICVTPDSLDFGNVSVSGIVDLSLTISNCGDEDLVLGDIEIGYDAESSFRIISTCARKVITSGDHCVMNIRFQPASEGVKTATLYIESNDPDGTPQTGASVRQWHNHFALLLCRHGS